MDASSRAQYLRIKRSSESLPDLTEAEKAELAKLEAAGHVKGSGDAKPKPARTRRPDPAPISGEIKTSGGALPVDELNYTWTLTFVVTAAPEIVAEGFDPLHCSSSEHMLRRIAVWQGNSNGEISVELCEASAPPADEILREQGYAGRELELELDRITTPWANWASASDIAAAHGLDVEDVEDALDETGVATSRAHSRAGRGWTLDPKAATVFSPAAIELVLGEIRRR